MELLGMRVTLSQGDKRDGIGERHFVKQFGCIIQVMRLNIKVEENVLSEQVETNTSLENMTVEVLPHVCVAVSNSLLEHVGVVMRIQCSSKAWLVLVMKMVTMT